LIEATVEPSRLGQVEHLEVHRDPPDAAANLERVDTIIDEVAKQLRPRTLFAVGGIPDAGLAVAVVTARTPGGICAGHQRVPGGALMPVVAAQRAARRGGDRAVQAHT